MQEEKGHCNGGVIVYEQAVDRVTASRVTWNPKPERLLRCPLAFFSAHQDKTGMVARAKHLTAIAMDQEYPVGDPLKFFQCWVYHSENTTMLRTGAELIGSVEGAGAAVSPGESNAAAPPGAADAVVDAAAAASERKARPQGGKAAKLDNARRRKREGTGERGDTDVDAILGRTDNIAMTMEKESKQRHGRHENNRRVQADKLALTAFTPWYNGATLSLPELVAALDGLREYDLRQARDSAEDQVGAAPLSATTGPLLLNQV